MKEVEHRCVRFRRERREGTWRKDGGLREREIERVAVCSECGKVRAGRFRRIVAIERERSESGPQGPDVTLRKLARRIDALFGDGALLRAGPLLRKVGGARAEADLESLASIAPIRLEYRPSAGSRRLHAVRVLDRAGLAEVARPGAAARRAKALAEASRDAATLVNPQARAIAEVLSPEVAASLDDRIVRTIAALARLVEDGDVTPARVFSAGVLGHSKALAGIRRRVERLVGSLERLGIRDAGATVLVGGSGVLHLERVAIDVGRVRHIGLAVQDVLALRTIDVPPGGLLVVENLTPFEACVDRLAGKDTLVVWSAGFPGRAVTHIVGRASDGGARVRVWCDLDLGGVRIARILDRAARGAAEPVLMDAAVIRDATSVIPLSPDQADAIRRDLARNPDARLAPTLRALLDRGAWIEQESLLPSALLAL